MPVIDLGSVVGPQGQQGVAGATGAQGIQGNPGPNQVTDQTSTNLNGVLFGSQSRVAVKPVDSAPTADSTNLVSSGGVKTALDTKANQAQLATVETGSTASRAYAIGEYFCWNGLLYRAKTAIGNGDTFTVNTNCEQVSEGGLNSIINKMRQAGSAQGRINNVAFAFDAKIGVYLAVLWPWTNISSVSSSAIYVIVLDTSSDYNYYKLAGPDAVTGITFNGTTLSVSWTQSGNTCRMWLCPLT